MPFAKLRSDWRQHALRLYRWSLLDWWPVLIGRQPFDDQASEPLPSRSQLREIFDDQEEKSIDAWLAFVDGLQVENESRRATIESKASMLSGSATIAVGLLTGFAGTMLDKGQVANRTIAWILVLFYSAAALMFLLSMVLSMRCLHAMSYPFMMLRPADMLAMARAPILDTKVHRLVDLYRCQAHNRGLINRKATYTTGAQECFVRGAFLAFWAAVTIASYSVIARAEGGRSDLVPKASRLDTLSSKAQIRVYIPISTVPDVDPGPP